MKIVVAGAGVSGLFAAYELARAGHEVTIVSKEVGGLVQSHVNNGFIFDFGGHVYNVRSPEISGWMPYLKGATIHDSRNAIYVAHGDDGYPTNIVDYPVQSSAAALGLVTNYGVDSAYRGETLETWGRRVFGDMFYSQWFGPFNARVWSTSPSAMDSDWISSRVTVPKDYQQKTSWGSNSSFVYAPGKSIIGYLRAMAESVGVIFVNSPVSITRASITSKTLATAIGILDYDRLISTLPISGIANRLYDGIGRINLPTNMVLTVGLGFEGKLGIDFHWAYNDVKYESHRITHLAAYSPDNAPAGCDSLLIEIPISNYKMPGKIVDIISEHLSTTEWPQIADNVLDKQTIDMLLKDAGMGYIIPNRLKVIVSSIIGFTGYPIPAFGCRKTVAKIKLQLMDNGVYSIGRWGSHGYFNVDHCAQEAKLLPTLIRDGSNRTEYLQSSFYYG